MPTRHEPKHRAERTADADDALEQRDTSAAIKAYRKAIAAEPSRLDSRTNLGRLLHESSRLAEAEEVYRAALKNCGNDPLLLYNFGVLLDDMDRKSRRWLRISSRSAAIPAWPTAITTLALLYEELERPRDAIRHMAQYRRLVAGKPSCRRSMPSTPSRPLRSSFPRKRESILTATLEHGFPLSAGMTANLGSLRGPGLGPARRALLRPRIAPLVRRVAKPIADHEHAPAPHVAHARELAEPPHDRIVVHDHRNAPSRDVAEPVA